MLSINRDSHMERETIARSMHGKVDQHMCHVPLMLYATYLPCHAYITYHAWNMFQLTRFMCTLKFSCWINFWVFHELVCTHEIKTTCYTQLCVTKLLQIVKSKPAKLLCSKLSQSIFLSTTQYRIYSRAGKVVPLILIRDWIYNQLGAHVTAEFHFWF